MMQYLLNATAIWLISLVMFDLLLRRESYHSYNRFYLLFTFLLGALLPLVQWQRSGYAYLVVIDRPVRQVVTAKQAFINATTPAAASINWQLWLTGIYLAGMAVSLFLLVIEIIKLSAAYTANRYNEGMWTVIETGKDHAPFSFLNTLFVCSRQQYDEEEWGMILLHEMRHTSLLHIADLMLMQMARVLFWFHPLVYLYNKHLLLVHEYQADSSGARQPRVYGRFLVEQAMLQSAPSLSHSFNRSPIKKRILMLSHRSSIAAKTKMLVFLPVLLVCLFCFSKSTQSQDKVWKNTNAVRFANEPSGGWLGHQLAGYDPIISDPQLISRVSGTAVTGFTISFQPKGKDFLGPYKVMGSARLDRNPKVMEVLSQLKSSDMETVVYVEDIHVNYSGKDSLEPSALIYRIHSQK